MTQKKPNQDNRQVRSRNADSSDRRLKKMRTVAYQKITGETGQQTDTMRENAVIDCGWGRLLFGQTFTDSDTLVTALQEERPDRRDIALYIHEPHVLLSLAPQRLFLDPSHTFRLELPTYRASRRKPRSFFVRRLTSRHDADEINRIYIARGMIPVPADFFWDRRDARAISYFVAEDEATGNILGVVTGVDHRRAFNDPERGSSLWCLAVDPQARHPGIGEFLVRHLAEFFKARGANHIDLSVLHDNEQAIKLYEKIGFRRIPVFAVKRKNPINEVLFSGPAADERLNPYAKIIVDEARRRGIAVDVIDADGGFFRLSYGGRSIQCRESLSEFTTSVAMSICDDKAVTRRVVEASGVRTPKQIPADATSEEIEAFTEAHRRVVVKPARGEQGRGISVGLSNPDDIRKAIDIARKVSDSVLIEECVEGQDLRIIVINYKLVAAAIRKPATVTGDGQHTIRALIERQSRRRAAATGGESQIPLDSETERTVEQAGYDFDTVLDAGKELEVRKTANLHTGGTLHDVTGILHRQLADAAIAAARAINIPVTGIDLMVKSPTEPDYAFIEANERPGLANHEPQPTAERFIDLLFPLTVSAAADRRRKEE